MELDENSLDGHWSTNNKTNMDFFIINDAIFSKLCILGDDVEPCFEGARITAPEVSTSFTKIDDNFKKTLYTMMQDLKFALEGGQKMTINEAETTVVETKKDETIEKTKIEEEVQETETSEEMSAEKDNEEQSATAEIDNPIEDQSSQENFAKADDKKEEEKSDEKSKDDSESSDDSKSDSKDDKKDSEEEDNEKKKDKKDYSLLETELENAKTAYADLEQKYQALVAFKEQVDNEKKDALIGSFYMLSDEDKKDVIENKSKYSLDEIEAKLSVICVRKKVNFDLEDASKKDDVEEHDVVTTYTVDNQDSTPAWIAAIRNTRNSRK